jgi:hypothetical protein
MFNVMFALAREMGKKTWEMWKRVICLLLEM